MEAWRDRTHLRKWLALVLEVQQLGDDLHIHYHMSWLEQVCILNLTAQCLRHFTSDNCKVVRLLSKRALIEASSNHLNSKACTM